VGAAGQLLTKIIEAINLSRDDVFIANVLKHRPRNPAWKRPTWEDVQLARRILDRADTTGA
jgi:DNA polymerase